MLSNLNSVILEGNLARDPQVKNTPNGHTVCNFAIASNRYYKYNEQNEHETSFFEVETWSRLAQTCGEMLKKGRGVRIVGRLKQDKWQDPSGKAMSKIKVIAEHVEFKPAMKKEDEEATMQDRVESREEEAVAAF
ncbi:MAG TPA: single-stranded DNA-binding protein [Spirochaetales bacterium]|nr:single-stranded DNA-binding protein [Spirochaetales bacterium]